MRIEDHQGAWALALGFTSPTVRPAHAADPHIMGKGGERVQDASGKVACLDRAVGRPNRDIVHLLKSGRQSSKRLLAPREVSAVDLGKLVRGTLLPPGNPAEAKR